MLIRTVLTLITASILLLSSHTVVNAKTSFWEILFTAPKIIKEVSVQKDSIHNFISIYELIKESKVLSAQTESETDNKNISDPESELFINTSTSTATPTSTPTPLPTTIPTDEPLQPSPTSAAKPTSPPSQSETDYILGQINNFRQQNGLPAASKDPLTCNFASVRAKELATSFTHNGFVQRKDSNGLPYPGWTNVTENIAMNSDYRGVINQWTNSSGHTENMLADTPHICVGKYGNYYAMEGWKP